MKRAAFLSLVFILMLGLSLAQALQAKRYAREIEAFEEFAEKQMKIDRIPGLSVGFMKDDFIWTRGFGYADLENKSPATERSSYRLASNTKSMTAVAILQLVEKGKIDLDAEVQRYVPYFPWKRWPVTVRELLGHLGGISHYKNYAVEGHIKEQKDTRDALAIFAGFELVAEPGTKFNYTSYGYNLLGAVIEGAAKQPYGDYLREHLWEPLGMSDTYMDNPDSIIPNRVKGYRLIEGRIKNSEFVDISSRFAAGGTRSTVVDLLKYARGLETERVLSRESIDMMYTSMATKDGHLTDYGMGWVVKPVNGRFHVYHTGGQPETRTLLVRFPKERFAFALAYNLEGANLHTYSHRLTQLILDEPWNLRAYTGDKIRDALYDGLWETFNYGLGYFDRYGEALSEGGEDLSRAFSYFNACVNPESLRASYEETKKKIRDGRHPTAGEAFVKTGSYIAAKLHEEFGDERIDTYHKAGALPFFADYVEICKKIPDYQDEPRLPYDLAELVTRWSRDWIRTAGEYTRRLAITPFSDLDKIGRRLKKLYGGAEVYPDFTRDLARVTRYLYIEGDREKAYKAARISLALYPNSPTSHMAMANAHVCFGEKDKARASYRKALELDSGKTETSAKTFSRYAMDLAANGKLDEAMAMLEIAVELRPEGAVLYDSMAEIHLWKAKRYYRKAARIDPTLEHPRNRLKKLE